MTKPLALKLALYGLRVNTVARGPLDTPLFRRHRTNSKTRELGLPFPSAELANGTRLALWPIVAMSIPWDVNDLMYVLQWVPPSHYVEMFCRSFDVLYEEGGQIAGAVAHTTIYGRPFGIWAYDQVIRYAKSFPKVWFATRQEIAEWYLDHYA